MVEVLVAILLNEAVGRVLQSMDTKTHKHSTKALSNETSMPKWAYHSFKSLLIFSLKWEK